MRRPREPADASSRGPAPVPDGWYPINPASPADAPTNNALGRHDRLGLATAVHAANIKVPRIQGNNADEASTTTARNSPRHCKLQEQHSRGTTYAAGDAFAPNKSLRLASLRPQPDTSGSMAAADGMGGLATTTSRPHLQHEATGGGPLRSMAICASPRSRAARFRVTAPAIVPVHEVVRGFDDGVDASPLAESNEAAVTELFLASWMGRFENERALYKSIAVHAEIAFRELYRLTANLAFPSDVVTAFACKILDDMTEHFGPFALIARVLSLEVRQAIYAPAPQPLPYFAIVKNQKRLLISLRKDLLQRQNRNHFLRFEINEVHETLLHFLDQCGLGLVRSIFREWYSAAVTSKRNSRKYVEYFSAWFGGSAKALVPRAFLAWKSQAVDVKVKRLHEQLTSDQEKLTVVQKRIEELAVQRNLAQLESLAVRNDRKHAEDAIQRLHRKIQSASSFLESSPRREALVAQEGQLRVEAVTFLPPLVLESMLRGFHNVGFLQPVHDEFVLPTAATGVLSDTAPLAVGGRKGSLLAPRFPQPLVSEPPSALRQCVIAMQNSILAHKQISPKCDEGAQPVPQGVDSSSSGHQNRQRTVASEIPVRECLRFLQGIKSRFEDDPTAYLLFVSKSNHQCSNNSQKETESSVDHEPEPHHERSRSLHELVRAFHAALASVRHQDEHYARHAKLFSSRMLEQSEISVVSPMHVSATPKAADTPVDTDTSAVGGAVTSCSTASGLHANGCVVLSTQRNDQLTGATDAASCISLDRVPLLQAQDLELSPRHTRAFVVLTLGQLMAEYGSLLFSPTDMTAFVRNRLLHKVMLRGIAGGKHTLRKIHVPMVEAQPSVDDELSSGDDPDEHDEHPDDTCTDTMQPAVSKKATASAAPAVGRLTKQTTQRQMQLVSRRMSSYRGLHAPSANAIDRGLSHLKTAYDVWNQLSQQLVETEIVQSRRTMEAPDPTVNGDMKTNNVGSSVSLNVSASPMDPTLDASTSSMGALRPRLQLHIEPLPSGPLMSSAKDKERVDTPTTPKSGHRRSMALASTAEWSYQTCKVRLLSLSDTQRLVAAVQGVHGVVSDTAQRRAVNYAMAKLNLKNISSMQWHHACELASQFTSTELCTTALAPSSPASISVETALESDSGVPLQADDRHHLFQCVSFDNEAIERLFSVEDHPEDELHRVQSLLEHKKNALRHALYCKHRPGATHAASLEDLWHVVKVLRLPRDVRVLPTLRDEELVGTSYFNEQFFSPDDVAEVLLQLCNEQFLPHIMPLSARVECFITHHLPLALQNQSAIREIMHKADVKKALSDHGQTLRTIFRRYCAKEKDLLAAAAAKRRTAMVAATAAGGVGPVAAPIVQPIQCGSSSAAASTTSVVASAAPQGITRFMRLAEWHAFISDYKLLRARFTAEYATAVFCNVQEAESGLEDNLEMIFGEFSEAIVALAVCFFPDPFLRHATRVHQFIRRFLPVSPDEVRDHHT